MKLEVGMYVRTDKNGIKKIYKIDNNKTKYKYLYKLKSQDDDGCIDLGVLSDNNIKKASFNIIDLIEVGDYVNEYKVSSIYNPTGEEIIQFTLVTEKGYKIINPYVKFFEIKSIVTKEQFEQMSYKVGE